MHTAVGNDMNEQMIVNSIDDFYLAITIDNGSTIMMSIICNMSVAKLQS